MAGHVCAPDDISSVNHQTQKSCPHSTFSRLHSFSHFVSAEERNTFSFLRGLNRKNTPTQQTNNIKHLMAIAPNCSMDALEQAHNSHTIISRRQTYYAYNSLKQVDSPIFIHMLHWLGQLLEQPSHAPRVGRAVKRSFFRHILKGKFCRVNSFLSANSQVAPFSKHVVKTCKVDQEHQITRFLKVGEPDMPRDLIQSS